jgi:ubiquinol-cytochrome c reductase cytochrome c1 subunit
MKLLKKLIAVVVLLPTLALANEEGYPLDHAPDRTRDLAALQNGAKLFVNYCLNCHSAASMRYNRLRDIGLNEDQIKANLLFTSDKVGDLMKVSLAAKDAKEWFGAAPPDLSVIARAKASEAGSGPDWIYTYLRTYYKDDSRPTGWNNLVFPNVGMPHVLWELQGVRTLKTVVEEKKPAEGGKPEAKEAHEEHQLPRLEQLKPGKLTALEYDNAVADLVGYLQWMSEPMQNTRKQLGVWVLLFLGMFVVITWRLNASYWKEVK